MAPAPVLRSGSDGTFAPVRMAPSWAAGTPVRVAPFAPAALVEFCHARKNAHTTRKPKNDATAEFDRLYLWGGWALET